NGVVEPVGRSEAPVASRRNEGATVDRERNIVRALQRAGRERENRRAADVVVERVDMPMLVGTERHARAVEFGRGWVRPVGRGGLLRIAGAATTGTQRE